MVYIIIVIGIVLIVINVKAIFKEDNSFDKKYASAKESITDFEIEIGKLRNEFAETLVELQSEIEELKRKVEFYEDRNFIVQKENHKIFEIDDEKYIEDIEEKQQSLPVNSNNIKIEQVNKMLKEGQTVDDIAEGLKLGKGEVLLIKELYLK